MDLFRTKSVERTLDETREEGRSLKRNLNAWDLALMCVAVAVGAGIFSVGAQAAAYYAGPSSIISFLIAGIVCGGTVLCYAEFTSMVPAAGSAYTFTYTTVGEFVAWIIGWDLVLEMLMAGAVVAKYWGVYLSDFTRLMGWNLRMTVQLGPVSFDWAPFLIIAFFTALLVIGTQLSARVDGTLTAIKIGIVLFIIVAGLFYIKWSNFVPFIPHSAPASSVRQGVSSGLMEQPLWQWISGRKATAYGVPGIFSGAALVFFAFVGFDAVATASEEAKNPEKTVPHGIILGLSIIIVLYMAVAFVTTGIVSYKTLAKAPNPSLSVAFELAGASWAAKIISIGIVIGMATVVMVLLLGLTRILFAMSRDGLLPRNLSKTNKRGTPAALQIGGAVVMAYIASFFDVSVLSDMVNIGTLSAFLLVSLAIPIMRNRRPDLKRGFTMPGNPWLPILTAVACVFISINLSVLTWIRFLVWLLIGFVVYFGYSYRHAGIRTLEVVDGELDAGASGDASSAESGDAVPAN